MPRQAGGRDAARRADVITNGAAASAGQRGDRDHDSRREAGWGIRAVEAKTEGRDGRDGPLVEARKAGEREASRGLEVPRRRRGWEGRRRHGRSGSRSTHRRRNGTGGEGEARGRENEIGGRGARQKKTRDGQEREARASGKRALSARSNGEPGGAQEARAERSAVGSRARVSGAVVKGKGGRKQGRKDIRQDGRAGQGCRRPRAFDPRGGNGGRSGRVTSLCALRGAAPA